MRQKNGEMLSYQHFPDSRSGRDSKPMNNRYKPHKQRIFPFSCHISCHESKKGGAPRIILETPPRTGG